MSLRLFLIGGKRRVEERAIVARVSFLTTHKSRITSHEFSICGGISSRNALIGNHAKSRAAILEAGANEGGKKRVRGERLRLEFRMKLATNEPGMIGHFDNLDIHAVGRPARDSETGARKRLLILAIKFVAMAMALGDFERAVSLMRKRPGLEFARPRPEPHRAAHLIHAQ